VRVLAFVLVAAALPGCRVLDSGLANQGGGNPRTDAAAQPEDAEPAWTDVDAVPSEVGEPPGVPGVPLAVGCSDGTREGFRDVANWPNIAGCAGGFDQPGVIGSPELPATCSLHGGDTSANPTGVGCSAADLCSEHWHLCRNGNDVAQHSPTGSCESCVPAGELRFFLTASGASSMGICSPDTAATNDLHGCGGLGQPEADTCAPLSRRMGFADCLATQGVWLCGEESNSLQEAALVTKPKSSMGGALCCRD